ncbi:MAG: cation:proton antiporter [Candidatus Izemoplasmatales bacterium]
MDLKVLFFVAIVLIVGLLFGKIAKALRMPNVTGYLVGGLILGPSLFGLVFGDGLISQEAIDALGIVSNVALGFIAFSIGNELKVSYFKRVGPGPIIIATLESLFAILFVLGGLVLYFWIAGKLDNFHMRFALVLAAIAAATAPAATLMVVRQYKAKGPLTETLMSVVALDDGTAIMFFGIFVAIANALSRTGTSTPIILQILEPIWEIVMSLGIGGAIGLIVVFGCKWFTGRGNRISLVVAAVFMTVYLADLAGGSPLLACMAMGGVFANLSPVYETVNGLIYFVTPPIFIMFFVLNGADLNLSVLSQIGIIGVIYVLLRVAGKIFGAWFGAKISKSPPVVSKLLGYALVPQAGVAIGLSLVAVQILDAETAAMIRAIILCATLIYELVGPFITKITLKKAGEITKES